MKNSPFKQETIFIVNGVRYKCHPVYDLYAGSTCGRIIHMKRQKSMIGDLSNMGYLLCMVRRSNAVKQKKKKEKKSTLFAGKKWGGGCFRDAENRTLLPSVSTLGCSLA